MEFHVSLVGRKDLTGEIYRQLRRAVLDGRLAPGDRLPPSRELARRLGVSRTTVMAAYDRLAGEGFVTSHVGAGTFVSDASRATGRARPTGGALHPRPVWDTFPLPTPLQQRAEFDFRARFPDATLFPYQTWRRLMTQQLRASAAEIGFYADPAGHHGLRRAIARYLGVSRGVSTTAGDVVVTNGSSQAVDLVARVLLKPGDQVAVEDPGYAPPWWLFETLGARVTGVPVDEQGLVVDAIPPRARLVHVTPSHQFPLGMTMSLPRRLALLAWAKRHDAAIVEDDYDSEFRYAGRSSRCKPWTWVGVSSTSARSPRPCCRPLRLGFVVTPASLRQALQRAKFLTDWYTAQPTQAALASFIDQGLLARHVRKARRVYQARHQQLVDGLAAELAEHLLVLPSEVGLHVAATARHASDHELDAVLRRASAAGVALLPVWRYVVGFPTPPGLMFGYGAIPTERIPEGLRRLRRCFEDR